MFRILVISGVIFLGLVLTGNETALRYVDNLDKLRYYDYRILDKEEGKIANEKSRAEYREAKQK